jgi:hypothetical protein
LEHNYAQNVVLFCEHGVLQERDAVRNSAKALAISFHVLVFDFRSKQ